MRVLVTGGTGFVGACLLPKLERPVVLTRDPARSQAALAKHQATAFSWDVQGGPPPREAFAGVDAVIHLAGEPVAEGRWTAAKKVRLRESRVQGTANLVAGLAALDVRPKVLVSASAVGYYGDRGDEPLPESAPPAEGFLAEICSAWEREALQARDLGLRVVCPRIGIVLGRGGGALQQMLPPFRMGLGSPLGSGRQWMPWIHLEDLARLLLFACETPSLSGPVNAAAPQPVRNREFTQALGRALHRPTFFPPVPGPMLNVMFGEFGQILLHSQNVQPEAALAAGFSFRFPELPAALADLFGK